MTSPRLRSLSVKGFRAFGGVEQSLNLPSDIAVVWGPNSKGKTSLAEAFEFLATGRITRRELMASSQDEFADALRNAHLTDSEEVYVAARIIAADGTPHEIKRVLTGDFGKKHDCTSRLEIDGATATEAGLAKFGISLSQPPLRAPVLAQHTLAYIFSVRPQDRATYFKTLLEVTDLDKLRSDIAALADDLKPPNDPLFTKFTTCAVVTVMKPVLASLLVTIPDPLTLASRLEDAASALIEGAGEKVPDTPGERLAAIGKILADRRTKTFPVRAFERKELAGWNPPTSDIWTRLDTYLGERKKVDEETRQLTALFDEALKLPAISAMTEAVDCPLCATESALTPARVQIIRRHVEDIRDFKTAETAAKSALAQLSASADALTNAAEAALPKYLKTTAAERRQIGFTLARIRELLGDGAGELLDSWLARIRPLARAGAALRRGAMQAYVLVEKQAADHAAALDPEKLRPVFAALSMLRTSFASAIDAYKVPESSLRTALNEVLDAQSDTAGWQDFLDVAGQPDKLRNALIDRKAHTTVEDELAAALKQIDRAKEQVLDDKFSDYSGLIQKWWERLRPDEPTFFSAV
ncbi:MAG: AAA family ATPase [Candidatus Methylomirabilales bacterium]